MMCEPGLLCRMEFKSTQPDQISTDRAAHFATNRYPPASAIVDLPIVLRRLCLAHDFRSAGRGMTKQEIRAFRVEAVMTQVDLAQTLGVARSLIIDLECGHRAVPAWVGLAMAALKADLPPYSAEPSILAEIDRNRHKRINARRSTAG